MKRALIREAKRNMRKRRDWFRKQPDELIREFAKHGDIGAVRELQRRRLR